MSVIVAATNLLKRSFVYGLGSGAGRLVGLLSLPFYTSYLSPEEYGVISLLLVVGMILRILCGVGSGGATGIVYFRKDSIEYRRTVIWSMFFLTAIASGMVIIIAPLLNSITPYFNSELPSYVTTSLLLTYCCLLALQMLSEPFLLSLQFDEHAKTYAGITFIGVLTGVVLTIILLDHALGIYGWLIGQGIGALVALILVIFFSRKHLGYPRVSGNMMKAIVCAWYPLLPGSIAMLLMLNSAPIFVASYASIETVGEFSVGYQLGMGMVLVTSAISTAWMPYFQSYMGRPVDASKIFPGLTGVYIWLMGGLALLFFIFAKPVTELMVDPRYHDAWKIVGLIALSQGMIGLWGMLLPGMYFTGETRFVSWVQCISAVISVLTFVFIVPKYGLLGAGLAMLSGPLVMVILQETMNKIRNYEVSSINVLSAAFSLLWIFIVSGAIWIATSDFPIVIAFGLSVFILVIHLAGGVRIYKSVLN